MGKLDGINVSEAAHFNRNIKGTSAPGRKEKLTKVIAFRNTSSVPNANMWNIVHVKTSKPMTLTQNKGATAATPVQKRLNGSALAEATGTDAMSIGIA